MKYEVVMAASFRRASDWPLVISVGAIAAIVVFYRLGDPAVYWWDEARVAVNSLEMTRAANPLIVTYKGAPDLWNTKPPLAIWLNALSMRVFGVSELALRLPAAIASILTTLAVALYTRRLSNRLTGLLAALILLGSGGFVEVHVARTAEYDALLILFMTLVAFCLAEQRWRSAALFLGAAVFTKGAAALLMAPGYAALGKDVRRFMVPAAIAGAAFVTFLAFRELSAPGYLSATFLQDVSRAAVPADGHSGQVSFYALRLMMPWQIILPFEMTEVPYISSAFPWVPFVLLAVRAPPPKPVAILFACLASLLIVLSLAATKLGWYAAPAYPLIAVLAALGIRRFRWLFLAALPLAAVSVALNLWKVEKEVGTTRISAEQRLPNFVRLLPYENMIFVRDFRWSGDPNYDGPLEFYAQVNGGTISDPDYAPRSGDIVAKCGPSKFPGAHVLHSDGACTAIAY